MENNQFDHINYLIKYKRTETLLENENKGSDDLQTEQLDWLKQKASQAYNYATNTASKAYDYGVNTAKQIKQTVSHWVDIVSPTMIDEFTTLFKNAGESYAKEVASWFGVYQKVPIKRVIFVAPGSDSENQIVSWLKQNRVVTFIINSLKEMLESFNLLEKRSGNTKQDEIVIGSHGNGKALFLPRKDKGKQETQTLDPQIVQKIKNNIHGQSIVYFTACFAADDLKNVAKLANDLNHPVYAASGVNAFGLASQGGHYMCRANSGVLDAKKQCKPINGTPINWFNSTKYV